MNQFKHENDQPQGMQFQDVVSERRPDFIPEGEIQQEAERIFQEVSPHLIEGIKVFAEEGGIDSSVYDADDKLRAWIWAVRASKYNAVYCVSRTDAIKELKFVKDNAELIDSIGDLIDSKGGAAPIINYSLHSYVQAFSRREGKQVKIAQKSIPPNAIQAEDANTLIVKRPEFLNRSPLVSLAVEEQIYDWHDLAHMLAASSSGGSFGAKYHQGLDSLHRYFRALTEGEGMQDATGSAYSDGLLFTQLSKPILEFYEGQTLPNGEAKYSYDEIQEHITDELFKYLGGKYELWHPGISSNIQSDRPIDALELAVCIQNKRYERRASEVEKEIFVRGTPEGPRGNPAKDPLNSLARSERIKYIAGTDNELLYFEARNITRHRAHEDALGRFAYHLLDKRRDELVKTTNTVEQAYLSEDIELLEACVDFFQMSDLKRGAEINLYQMVGDIINAREERLREAR